MHTLVQMWQRAWALQWSRTPARWRPWLCGGRCTWSQHACMCLLCTPVCWSRAACSSLPTQLKLSWCTPSPLVPCTELSVVWNWPSRTHLSSAQAIIARTVVGVYGTAESTDLGHMKEYELGLRKARLILSCRLAWERP